LISIFRVPVEYKPSVDGLKYKKINPYSKHLLLKCAKSFPIGQLPWDVPD